MFRTEIQIDESKNKLDYSKAVVLIGSCFSENIGEIMKECRLPVTINPFGILFNPESIAVCLDRLVEGKEFTPEELFSHNDNHHSWLHHGRFSAKNTEQVIHKINTELNSGHLALQEADTLIITFGTAWAYKLRKTNSIVGNCHKVPQVNFEKYLITHSEIEKRFGALTERLLNFNPKLKIIISVSPVRHWKDGAHQNNISKGHLHIATEALCAQHEHMQYFPSYELVLDELRDYRFFKDDMLHPSPLASEFVWEKFSACYFDENTNKTSKKIRKLNRVFSHKAGDTKKHEELMKSTEDKIQNLISKA